MKRFFIILALIVTPIILANIGHHSPFDASAQINWVNFDRVKVFGQNGRTCAFPSDSNFEDNHFWKDKIWCISLGKEVRRGVYFIIDEDGNNTGSLIQIGQSGLSGCWGWLSLEYTNAEKPDIPAYRDYPRYFHTRHYSLMLHP